MLEKGADVDGTPRDDDAPLLAAAEAGHTAMVKLLLEAGAEPNTASVGLNRTTALVDALQKGDGPTVHLLIDAGARVRAPDRYWGDAFRYAAPHPDLVRALTRLGEDLDAEDELRRLPVEQVIKFGVPESLEVMLAASPSVRCSRVPSLLDPERSRQTDPEITAAMADILARHCPGGRAASAPR